MIKSIKNITAAIIIVSAVGLISSMAVTIVNCPATDCMAAVTFYKMSYKMQESTPSTISAVPEISIEDTAKAAKVVSTYSLIVAVAIMIALEAFELRYLKLFLNAKRRRTTVSRR